VKNGESQRTQPSSAYRCLQKTIPRSLMSCTLSQGVPKTGLCCCLFCSRRLIFSLSPFRTHVIEVVPDAQLSSSFRPSFGFYCLTHSLSSRIPFFAGQSRFCSYLLYLLAQVSTSIQDQQQQLRRQPVILQREPRPPRQ
jgi:hypothetical protein